MPQITLRIDPEIEQKIRELAKGSGKSLNRVVQEIISQHASFRTKGKGSAARSLKKLAGGWTEKEASEFMAAIKPCEQIDEDMWK
ncbi:MAG: toxin-antitoxin system HicB family antitoxin [Desulfobacterales bacterium]|nr:toxin-antitoxin system HicB family antitoxin [Desulfobacterales bacterium]